MAQPPVYSQQAPMAQQPVYYQQTGPQAIPLASLGAEPNWVDCPSCRARQCTRVEYVAGTTTHLWALGFCCCLCLGCIPYCISGLKNAEHHCGNCGALLATYKRGSGTEVNAAPGQEQAPVKL